ncbi:hypothetical protein [Enterocloster phage PMBT24]|uniref:Uncharacterized protein n=1 Tax=Enterocloster phage PMBT24 TaxID=3025413 RepID=A0AAT9TRG4_9CAUD|nr:hypothetical protein [Enterocloster phage PMBT24]
MTYRLLHFTLSNYQCSINKNRQSLKLLHFKDCLYLFIRFYNGLIYFSNYN